MKKKLKLYIAHSLAHRKKIRKTQLEIEAKFNLKLVNPFYEQIREEINILDQMTCKEDKDLYKQSWSDEACQSIVEMDLKMIRHCDGLLVFLVSNEALIGTSMEMQFAHMLNMKIFIITQNYQYHPWCRYYATQIFSSITEFKKWCRKDGYEKKM